MYRVLDLFSGIGGFSLGLEGTGGFKTVAFCEIEPFCQAVLRKHWPDVPIFGDVRTLTAEDVADADYQRQSQSQRLISDIRRRAGDKGVDVICGGFPCQDISTAGRGAGITGERSGLWSEYARLIGEIRPRYVIVENVAALLGRGLERVLGDLAALGFDAEWHCIPASAVGAPHRRDRIWIMAHSRRLDCDERGGKCRGQEAAGSCDWPTRSGQYAYDVADADAPRCANIEGQPTTASFGDGWLAAGLVDCLGRSNDHWLAEPDVGRVAHGVPSKLDGSGDGKEKHASEEGAQGDSGNNFVSGVRRDGRSGAPSSRLCESRFGGSLMSILSRQSGSERWHKTHETAEELRPLRQGIYTNAQQEAHALQPGMSRYRWPHECGEALGQIWSAEPNVGRVASGAPNRVHRLRALGNAIVPQIAEIIGRAILASDAPCSLVTERRPP